MDQTPVAVIGFGTAGFNACIGLRLSGYTGRIQVFSAHDTLPYSPIMTSYYAGGACGYEDCFPWSRAEIEELDLEVMNGHPVTRLDTEGHLIHAGDGSFPYSKCIIASGSVPTPVGFPKDCGYAPFMLRTMEDAEALKKALEDPGCNKMLVSGTSMVSLKAVEACLNQGVEVVLVGIMDHVLDMNALPEAAARFEKGLIEKGVKLNLANPIKAVSVVEDASHPLGRILEVEFANGDTDRFDQIFVAHGMKNNLDFLEEGSIAIDRGILVDEFMRSSDPDVYAAGDVAQGVDLISGQPRIIGIWKNAALQGACAGKTAAAELSGKKPCDAWAIPGSFSTNTIEVDGCLFISAGSIQLDDSCEVEIEEDDLMTVIKIFQNMRSGKRLIGFNITCDQDVPGGDAYDIGAMLSLRMKKELAAS